MNRILRDPYLECYLNISVQERYSGLSFLSIVPQSSGNRCMLFIYMKTLYTVMYLLFDFLSFGDSGFKLDCHDRLKANCLICSSSILKPLNRI